MKSPGYDYLIDMLDNICSTIINSLIEDELPLGILKNSSIFVAYKVEQTLASASKTFVVTLFDSNNQDYKFKFHSSNQIVAHDFIISIEPFKESSTTQDFKKIEKGNIVLNKIQHIIELCLEAKHKQLQYFKCTKKV